MPLEDVSVKLLKEHITNLAHNRDPVSGYMGLERARRYIRDRMAHFGCYIFDHGWRVGKRTFYNIIGEKPSGFQLLPALMILTHYDTDEGTPGADDATGPAVMLEAIRLISLRAPQVRALYSAIVSGRALRDNTSVGGEALVNYIRGRGIRLDAILYIGSVGIAGNQFGQAPFDGPVAPFLQKGDLVVFWNERSKELVEHFLRVKYRAARALGLFPVMLSENDEASPAPRWGDHVPFWDHGYRALLIHDMANLRYPHYGSQKDTPDELNYELLVDVCRCIVAFAEDLFSNLRIMS